MKADVEPALLSLLKQGIPGKIESVPPQSPEMVGGAERSVRRLKEQWSCLRYDAQIFGYDYKFNEESASVICRYMSTTYNLFHHVHGGSATPNELVSARRPGTVMICAALGSVVFAEAPSSVETPAGTRWIPCSFLAYLHGSKACLVSGLVGPSLEAAKPKVFQAKGIRVLNRIVFEETYVPELLVKVSNKKPSVEDVSKRDDAELRIQPPVMPKTGPPISWLREHGKTKDCFACNNRVSHGRVHSKAFKERYLRWAREQSSLEKVPAPAESLPEPVKFDPGLPEPIPEPIPPDFDPNEARPDDDDDDMEYTPPSPGDQWDGDVEMGNESDEEMEIVPQFACRFCSSFDLFQQDDDKSLIISPMILPKVGSPTVYEPFDLSQKRVFLAEPTKVFAETTYETLDVAKTKEGRLVELKSMNMVKFGKVVDRKEAFSYP